MNANQPIAVVGMSGIFPGALNLDIFWRNIIGKVDAARDVDPGRWIVAPEAIYDPEPKADKAYSKRACLIEGFEFDAEGFDLEPDLLKALDPLHQIVLQTGRDALSACRLSAVDKKRIGVILAAIALPTDAASYMSREILGSAFAEKLLKEQYTPRKNRLGPYQALAAKVTALPAALLARALGLGGGTYTLDAACASSLYALKLACDELSHFRADAMLAGGVSRPDCLYTQVGFSQLKALSPSGRCAPFDESADGLVVGEGAGILVLKRLADALAAGDTVYGVIRGIGLSNDIGGNLLSPHSEGQVRALRKAYQAAAWRPADVDLIECHGAGTPLGDATELNSLRVLWEAETWREGQCPIGSVKSMTGHLLTAAGAAGAIKILLAIKHRILPPSLKFSKPPANSPLRKSPFRIQTEVEPWPRRDDRTPLRAAVSAFGFGGINAHLLIEEWQDNLPAKRLPLKSGASKQAPVQNSLSIQSAPEARATSVAVVGMDAAVGSLRSLRDFQELIFNGGSLITKRPENRWKGGDGVVSRYLEAPDLPGAFMDGLSVGLGEFHIPPAEIPDIVPQHLLMLKVAAGAMRDAGMPLREERPDMSVLIGMGFDFEATNFHLRWNLHNQSAEWEKALGLALDESAHVRWLEQLWDACAPPLTTTRTLGALGGIIASRIAREFRLGGPSFVVSAEEASGLRALEIGLRSLQAGETDAVLVGAVDLVGDVRSIISSHLIRPYAREDKVRPFDRLAAGGLPGEGACALVLKRLDRALKDKDRIYAVVSGIGSAGGGGVVGLPSAEAYQRSLARALNDAAMSPDTVSFLETHGSGEPREDGLEAGALEAFFPPRAPSGRDACALGSLKANIGHTGAAAGLFSLVKAALCLYHQMLPPLVNFQQPPQNTWKGGRFHIPIKPQYWLRNRQAGPRRAVAGALSADGNCMHVVLEEAAPLDAAVERRTTAASTLTARSRPLGLNPWGLFCLTADEKNDLIQELEVLKSHCRKSAAAGLPVETAARHWYKKQPLNPRGKFAVALLSADFAGLESQVEAAGQAILSERPLKIASSGGWAYTPRPVGPSGALAFVFPGSGNHYAGMGREIALRWPDILREMDSEAGQLKNQMLPHVYMPWKTAWPSGWETEAALGIASDPLNTIFGQVVFGGLMTKLLGRFDLRPKAVIGYSLGESTGLFALGLWPNREEMLARMQNTDLFTSELAGPCRSLRKAWNIAPADPFAWRVAAVNQPADRVSAVVAGHPHVRLLIVNTPTECVIGGRSEQVADTIRELACEAVFIEGVVTVHCDAALPVAEAYRRLHVFPLSPPEGIRFYSCAYGRTYEMTSDSVAASVLQQAVEGFDFTKTVNQAYADGLRVFLELGPHASCTRMIDQILDGRPHLAVSTSARQENELFSLLKCLGTLIAERVPLSLEPLYGDAAFPIAGAYAPAEEGRSRVHLPIGGAAPAPELPGPVQRHRPKAVDPPDRAIPASSPFSLPELLEPLKQSVEATSRAHQRFLNFSAELQQTITEALELEKRLAAELKTGAPPTAAVQKPLYDRGMCLEFAVGSAARVLGPEFAELDTYKARVRLPDEPLMLVDRILSIEGEKASLGPGRIVTEHDVLPGAWYLDGGRAPACISVEAGQADLFLCAYLGIDLAVKGVRTYRLLDATVKFHRGLPRPGDTLRYEIEIERFARQGDTYLFFFHFEGFIGRQPLITMTNGCAGFFTPEEVRQSGGIIRTEEPIPAAAPSSPPSPESMRPLIPRTAEQYDEQGLQALREGRLADCFGPLFDGVDISPSLRLPGGKMKLIDRVPLLDPVGGRYQRGIIRAEADIHPDDWFLTCHFVDDMVMPGTLMYECCEHTLRVFLQRIGWVVDHSDSAYEPLTGVESVLKCRGPVTPETRRVTYEVEIKELGYAPVPYVIADANMYADDHFIVHFNDISMTLAGAGTESLEAFWERKLSPAAPAPTARILPSVQTAAFDRGHILTFATGSPSAAFGEPYAPFDNERFIARLPAPPYSFIDRITRVEPPPWKLEPDGWIEAELDIDPEAWYFKADRSRIVPYAVLLEAALQPCGWLAAYMGSALKSSQELKFRNLGGTAALKGAVSREDGKIQVRARLTKVSEAADMLIEHFDFKVSTERRTVYTGNTYFGFFTQDALSRQVGIRAADRQIYAPSEQELNKGRSAVLPNEAPLTPEDKAADPAPPLAMPARALRMIDKIEAYIPDGGPQGLGFVRGTKSVDADEWFFKAHFYQDPVCPGSLGIESFLQLLKFAAIERWPHLSESHCFSFPPAQSHRWLYRGQIVPENRRIEVDALITQVLEGPQPTLVADGLLRVDGITIYQMEDFALCLVPVDEK